MIFTDLLLDTLRTLWAHKLRTFLTMFGIAWGIISITLMVAAGEGLRVGQQKQNETFGKDLMIVFEGRPSPLFSPLFFEVGFEGNDNLDGGPWDAWEMEKAPVGDRS